MEKKENKKSKEEISIEDIPFVGGLFKGLEKFVDLAERVEKAGGEIRREGEIRGGTKEKPIRGIYGFSIGTGLGKGAKPQVQTFGNIKKTTKGPIFEKTRGPIVDVFDEKDYIIIVAELPGVAEESIKLNLKGDILILEAGDEKRKYAKEILLPAKVDFASREVKFKNGILELKFKKVIKN